MPASTSKNSTTTTPRSRNLATQQAAGRRFGVTPRTIRAWITQGKISGFRMPGGRAIRVDLNEIEALVQRIPTVTEKRVPFGPKATIHDLRNVVEPVVVEDTDADEEAGQ